MSSFILAANPAAVDAFARADYAAVLSLLRSAPKTDPDAALLRGQAHYQLGEFDSAADHLERAVAAKPTAANRHLWLGRAYGMKAESANPFSAMGLARKARDSFAKAVELEPRNIEAVSDLFSYFLAAPSFLGGGADKAAALADTIRTVDPAEFAAMRAQLAEKAKDFAEAERLYQEAQRLEPKRIGRLIDLAKFYSRRSLIPKADDQLAKAKALQPGASRLLYDEANLLVRQGREGARARRLLQSYQSAPKTARDPAPFEVKQLMAKAEKLEK